MFEGGCDQLLTEEMVEESLGNRREDKTPGIDENHNDEIPKVPERGET